MLLTAYRRVGLYVNLLKGIVEMNIIVMALMVVPSENN